MSIQIHRRKGITDKLVSIVLMLIMVTTIFAIAFQNISGTGELIRLETVDIMSERIESGIIAVNSIENSKIEMEFRGSGYKIYTEGGDNYIEYEFLTRTNSKKFGEDLGIDYQINENSDNEKFNNLCIENLETRANIILTPGGC